jgi:uncharacterized protein with HEPN domain
MRSDEAHFLDMLLAAQKVRHFAEGLTKETFHQSELHQSAIIRELQVIGEAARQVSEAAKNRHPEIDWKKIAGMRNRLIHEYFQIRLDIVWEIARDDIPPLIAHLDPLVPPNNDERS